MKKVLIHSVYSNRDKFGNVYSYAIFTNPITGESFKALDQGINAKHIAHKVFNDYNLIYCTEEFLPIREFNRQVKGIKYMPYDEIISKLASWK